MVEIRARSPYFGQEMKLFANVRTDPVGACAKHSRKRLEMGEWAEMWLIRSLTV